MDPALNIYLKAADMAYDIGEIHVLTPDCAHHDTLLRQQEVFGCSTRLSTAVMCKPIP